MKKLMKSAILIFIMMLLAKFLALLKEILLAQKFATSYIVDAYMVITSLPTIIFTVFASGFSNSYLPVFMRVEEGKKNDFFNNVFNILLIISLLLVMICFIFIKEIVFLLAPGFDERTRDIAIKFARIVIFYLPFYTLFAILSAHFQAKEKFILNNFCDFVLTNIILIISMFITSPNNPEILLYGYVISGIFSFLILYIRYIKNDKNNYRVKVNFKDNNFKQLYKIAIPFGLSSLINQLNTMIDKIFSSSLGEGITSALNYANKLQLLPYSLIVSIILGVLSPKINKAFAIQDRKSVLLYIQIVIMISLYISLPVLIILFGFSEQIVKFLFERKEFTSKSTILVANCLAYYALGIPFYALREIFTRILMANYRQKIVLKNTIISVVLNIILNIIFIRFIDYKGLALSTSLSGIVSCLLMNYSLKEFNLKLFNKNEMKEILKIIISSLGIFVISLYFYKNMLFFMKSNVAFFISICISILMYLIFTYFFKVKILMYLVEEIKKIKFNT